MNTTVENKQNDWSFAGDEIPKHPVLCYSPIFGEFKGLIQPSYNATALDTDPMYKSICGNVRVMPITKWKQILN
jgi:hypothetical protein